MQTTTILASLVLACLLPSAFGQAPNTQAKFYPSLRTLSYNATYFILPIADTEAKKLASPYGLTPVPQGAGTIFPNGFPAGYHPIVVNQGYQNDIRMTAGNFLPLAIPNLMGSAVLLPFVDRKANGKTPFLKSITNFIGGVNGQAVSGLVPALVGSLEGTPILVGSFDPNNQAYKSIDATPNTLSAQTKQIIVPNPVSGPGVTPSAIDLLFRPANSSPVYPARAFIALMNQPTILTTGQCQLNAYYFNETFANPMLRTGDVTLYNPAVPGALTGGINKAKQYTAVGGLSATAESVGLNPKACSSFS